MTNDGERADARDDGASVHRALALEMTNFLQRKFTRNEVMMEVPCDIQVGMPNQSMSFGPPSMPAALPTAATPAKSRNSMSFECFPWVNTHFTFSA